MREFHLPVTWGSVVCQGIILGQEPPRGKLRPLPQAAWGSRALGKGSGRRLSVVLGPSSSSSLHSAAWLERPVHDQGMGLEGTREVSTDFWDVSREMDLLTLGLGGAAWSLLVVRDGACPFVSIKVFPFLPYRHCAATLLLLSSERADSQ